MNPTTAKKIAKEQGTRRQWHPTYDEIPNKPKCSTPGCSNRRTVMDYHWTSGKPVYRPICSPCHEAVTVDNYRTKTGVTWVKTIGDVVAHKAGFSNSVDYLNTKHPYRQYRKDHCENTDSRLGYRCTTTILWTGQLDVHHVDQDPTNNKPENLVTLCKCCHAYAHKDQPQTPGRKYYAML